MQQFFTTAITVTGQPLFQTPNVYFPEIHAIETCILSEIVVTYNFQLVGYGNFNLMASNF